MPSNMPPTRPSLAWNSSMILALKSAAKWTLDSLDRERASLAVLGHPRRMRLESHRWNRIGVGQRVDLALCQRGPERGRSAELFVAAHQALAEQRQVEVAVVDGVYVERGVRSLEARLRVACSRAGGGGVCPGGAERSRLFGPLLRSDSSRAGLAVRSSRRCPLMPAAGPVSLLAFARNDGSGSALARGVCRAYDCAQSAPERLRQTVGDRRPCHARGGDLALDRILRGRSTGSTPARTALARAPVRGCSVREWRSPSRSRRRRAMRLRPRG